MSSQITVTYQAEDSAGMTVQELHTRLAEMLTQGIPGDTVVRVRTKLGANKHGAVIKAVTGATGGAR
ncbi:hypothetical protein [Pseudonocardia zijingensis]|uniref:Uncharacterized protein n=1 Tax=Pseudonocardia zijingensis TaxID=153376 RepID=A0ABP3YR65_9PSEU